jgi:hypothetical protein
MIKIKNFNKDTWTLFKEIDGSKDKINFLHKITEEIEKSISNSNNKKSMPKIN